MKLYYISKLLKVNYLALKQFFLVVTILLSIFSKSFAEVEEMNEIIRLDSISFACDSVMYTGDTLNVQVKFTSFIKDTINLALMYQPGFEIIGGDTTKRGKFESIIVDTNTQYTRNFQVIVKNEVENRLDLFIKAKIQPTPSIELINSSQTFVPRTPDNGIKFPVRIAENDCIQKDFTNQIDDECEVYNFNPMICQTSLIDTSHYVSIEGIVEFADWMEPKYKDSDAISFHSPFTEVWLFFKTQGPTLQLTHPVNYDSTGAIEGVHFAKCDSTGKFEFEFRYDLEKVRCMNQPYEIVLFVAKENEALWLESPTNHIKILNARNKYRTTTPQYIRCLKPEEFSGEIIDSNNNYINGTKPIIFKINCYDGSIFRHITLSKKFLKSIYSPIEYDSLKLPYSYVFSNMYQDPSSADCNDISMLWTSQLENRTLSHEFAHHFDCNNSIFYSRSIEREGFALFFSWIYRAWLNNVYGDRIDTLSDNCEIGPFTEVTNTFSKNGVIDSSKTQYYNRFGNITKIREVNGRQMCSFACFLWNLYDGNNLGKFGYFPYNGKENDDVTGLHSLLFSYFRTNTRSYYKDAISDIKQFFNNPILNPSIDKTYYFMDFDSNLALGSLPHIMRSPNLNFNYYILNSNLVVKWGNSQAYNFWTNPKEIKAYGKEDGYDKTSTFLISCFNNTEEGVRWYSYDYQNNSWNTPTIVPVNLDSLILSIASNAKYKVVTYNTKGGDSYLPFEYEIIYKKSLLESNEFNLIINLYSSENNLYFTLFENALVNIEFFDMLGNQFLSTLNFEKCNSGENQYNFQDLLISSTKVAIIRIIAISESKVIESKILKILY